jgi:hypothetical protein
MNIYAIIIIVVGLIVIFSGILYKIQQMEGRVNVYSKYFFRISVLLLLGYSAYLFFQSSIK